LAYGVSEVAHGSGLLAVYLTALALGSARIPAKRSVVSFHEGLGWVSQIGLFILLGLLVFPGDLGGVAAKGLALSAVLIFPARHLCRRRLPRVQVAREAAAGLGGPAGGDADLAGDLPGRRRGAQWRGRVRDRLLRRRHFDLGPGGQLRAVGEATAADHRRAGA